MNRVKILFKHEEDLIDIEMKIVDGELIGIFRDRKTGEVEKEKLGGLDTRIFNLFEADPEGTVTMWAKAYIDDAFKPKRFRDFKIIDMDSRGGKRDNSGRKKQPEKVKTSISITKDIYDYIDNYSDNTFSGSLEDLVKEERDE